ncbi:Uncharacterised protein [Yersinia similis]|nr:Uncharacterised protein [Yersinia similis]
MLFFSISELIVVSVALASSFSSSLPPERIVFILALLRSDSVKKPSTTEVILAVLSSFNVKILPVLTAVCSALALSVSVKLLPSFIMAFTTFCFLLRVDFPTTIPSWAGAAITDELLNIKRVAAINVAIGLLFLLKKSVSLWFLRFFDMFFCDLFEFFMIESLLIRVCVQINK